MEETGAVQLPEVTEDPRLDALVALIQDASAFVQGKLTAPLFAESAAIFIDVIAALAQQKAV